MARSLLVGTRLYDCHTEESQTMAKLQVPNYKNEREGQDTTSAEAGRHAPMACATDALNT